MRKKSSKYNAMGFVEALIAIIIVGVSSVVLMQIAANTLKNAMQNERIDKVTQYAVEGGNMVRAIKDNDGLPPLANIPPTTSPNLTYCLVPILQSDGKVLFKKDSLDGSFVTCNYSTGRESCKGSQIGAIPSERSGASPEFFRVACLQKPPFSTPDHNHIVVKVVVGQIAKSDEDKDISKEATVRDYIYQTTINLE